MTTVVACRALRAEAEKALANIGEREIELRDCRGQCRRSNLGAKDLGWVQDLLANSPDLIMICRCPVDRSALPGAQPKIVQVNDLEELFVEPGTYQALLDGESFVVTSGWVLNWKANLKMMGLDKDSFGRSAGASLKEVVLLDTLPGSPAAAELASFAEHIGLPYRIIECDLKRLEDLLRSLIGPRRDEVDVTALRARLEQAERTAADYAMTFDFLSTIGLADGESMVISSIMGLFEMLFAPRAIRYTRLDEGGAIDTRCSDDTIGAAPDLSWVEDGKASIETPGGFAFVIRSNDRPVGAVEVVEVSFPENRQRYLDQALSIQGALGLAIANARAIEAVKRSEEESRRRSEELESFFGLSVDLLAIGSLDGSFVKMSRQWMKVLGYSWEELTSTSFLDLVHPDDASAAREAYQRPGTIDVHNLLNRVRHKDGHYLWFEWNVASHGERSFIVARDVTERRQVQQQIMDSERKYRLLAENTSDVIWTLDVATERLTYISPSVVRLRGFTVEEALGQNLRESVSPEDYTMISEIVADSVARFLAGEIDGHRFLGNVRQPTKDGGWVDVEVAATLYRDDSGRIGVLGVSRDVTARKKAEEALQRRTEELESFFSLDLGLLAITSLDGRLLRVNRGWESTLWYTVGQLEGTSYLDYIHPDDIPATLAAMKDLTEQKEILHFVNRYRRADGVYRWIEWYAIPHGNHVYAQARDVTERKQMEDALQQAYAKLNILSSITRHDVNNQLTALMGNLELMGAMKLGPAAEQRIQRSKAAVENISSMIQFTKLYEEVGIKAPQWHELRTLVGNSVREVQLGHIKVVNDIPAGIEVFADPLISKVFYNLAHNAIRHGGDLTRIHFSLEESGGGLIVACQDDGVGLTPESRETLFMKGRGKDHGFGLYLSKEILAITKIGIRENGQGRKGARFEVMVPPGGWRRAAEDR